MSRQVSIQPSARRPLSRRNRRDEAVRKASRVAPLRSTPLDGRRHDLVAIVGLIILGAVLYGRTVSFEFTRTDDKVLLVDDAKFIENPSSAARVFGRTFFAGNGRGEKYYRPLVTLTFILDSQWAGVAPRAFHVTNLMLHVGVTCLFFLLLRCLCFEVAAAAFGAALFAVHPALTEAVVWIPGRCDLLLGLAVLVSTFFFVRFLDSPGSTPFCGHVLGWFLALLCKEAAIALPLVLMAYVFLVDGRRHRLREPRLWWGWSITVAVWYLLRSTASNPVAAEVPTERLGVLVDHLPAYLMHLGKLLWPSRLAVLANARDTSLLPGLIAAGVLALAGLWLRGRSRRLFLWGLSVFVLFILPSLPVSDFLILENRLYVPAIGIILSLLVLAEEIRARAASRVSGPFFSVAAALAVVLLAMRAWFYSEEFRNPAIFTAAAVVESPRLGLAHLNRGIVLQLDGRAEAAEHEYEVAIGLDSELAITHNNLGLIFLGRGNLARAEGAFRRELEVNPGYDKAYFNLGLALARQGRLAEAAVAWREAVRQNPDNGEARSQLEAAERALQSGSAPPVAGAVPVHLSQVPADQVVGLYEEALRRDPGNGQI